MLSRCTLIVFFFMKSHAREDLGRGVQLVLKLKKIKELFCCCTIIKTRIRKSLFLFWLRVQIPGRWFWPPDPAGKHRKSLELGSSIPTGNGPDFSGGYLPTSCAFRYEPAGNYRKKSENFLAGILLPQNHRNYPESAVSGPGCSTWGGCGLKYNSSVLIGWIISFHELHHE